MFIESVRARATCNTIISSHPVSSHRPCTNSFLLSVHASHSFSLLIFFFVFLSPILPLPSLFTFTFLFTSSSSLPLLTQFDFFVLKSCLFVRCLLGSRYFSSSSSIFSLIFFPVTPFLLLFFHSIHRHHLISTLHVCIRFFLYRNPHRAFAILSPVVFTTSIQSYLIWKRLAWNRHATVPPFSLFDQSRESFIHFWHRGKRNRDRIPGVDYECHFYMTLFSYFSVFPFLFRVVRLCSTFTL